MNQNQRFLLGTAVIAFILLMIYLLSLLWGRGERPLYILNNTKNNIVAINTQPQLVNFSDLNEDPLAYLNQRLRVAGQYTPLGTPLCDPASGPQFQWALLDGSTQMNATGFDSVLKLLPADTLIQVDGFWRRYEGPLGCGKQPAEGVVFYLEVTNIVQPNPLVGSDGVVLIVTPTAVTPLDEPTPILTGTLAITSTLTTTPTSQSITLTTTITNTPTSTPTATPTIDMTNTPSATPLPNVTLTATPTPTPSRTPTNTPTIDPSSSPTPTTDPAITPTPSQTPEPFPTDPNTDPIPTLPQTTPDDGYPPPSYP